MRNLWKQETSGNVAQRLEAGTKQIDTVTSEEGVPIVSEDEQSKPKRVAESRLS